MKCCSGLYSACYQSVDRKPVCRKPVCRYTACACLHSARSRQRWAGTEQRTTSHGSHSLAAHRSRDRRRPLGGSGIF